MVHNYLYREGQVVWNKHNYSLKICRSGEDGRNLEHILNVLFRNIFSNNRNVGEKNPQGIKKILTSVPDREKKPGIQRLKNKQTARKARQAHIEAFRTCWEF